MGFSPEIIEILKPVHDMPEETRPIEPELLERLGRVVVTWSVIERWISELFIFITKGTPGLMYVVTESISQSTLTGWNRTLLDIVDIPTEILDELRDILNEVDELRAERNMLVHGLWGTSGPADSVVVQTVRLDRKDIVRDVVITASDLDDLIDRILQLHARFFTVAVAVGMRTPSHGGTP